MDASDVESESKTHRDEIKKRKKLRKLNKLLKRRKEGKKKPKTSNHEKKARKFFCDRQEADKLLANKRLTTGRLKLHQTQQEGIFMKGLRSQYISRELLNETNEARKNEDLNKIIDIGRARMGKGPGIPENDFKNRSRDCSKLPKDVKLQSIFNLVKSFEFDDFEKCPLSPIRWNTTVQDDDDSFVNSPTVSTSFFFRQEEPPAPFRPGKSKKVEIDFKKEFEKFASLIEENCSSQILAKLRGKGVSECALESLKELRVDCQRKGETVAPPTEKMRKTEFLSGFELIAKTQQSFIRPEQDDFYGRCAVERLNFPATQEQTLLPMNCDPVDERFEHLKNDLVSDGLTYLRLNSITTNQIAASLPESETSPLFYSSTKNSSLDSAFQRPGSKKSYKEFEFVTPPIHFYRRNMF